MTIWVRSAIVIVLTTTGLCASSITYDSSIYGIPPSSIDGDPLDVNVPQFDASLGTLDSMSWTLSVAQSIGFIVDDCAHQENGDGPTEEDYSYTVTAGVTVPAFDATVGNTTSGSGTTLGTCPGGGAGIGFEQNLMASGTVSDPSAFIGMGTTTVEIDPFETGFFDIALPDYGGPDIVRTNIDLSVTYMYTSTPEPVMLPMLLSLIGVLLLFAQWRKARSQ